MSIKLVIVFCLISVAYAGFLPYYHPPPTIIKKIIHAPAPQPAEAPANYDFNYEVHDEHSGDIKRQKETAENGKVSGEYSLVEPDGLFRRIVTYTADAEHGFQADVRREPWGKQPAPAAPQPQQPATIIKKIIAPYGHYPYAYPAW